MEWRQQCTEEKQEQEQAAEKEDSEDSEENPFYVLEYARDNFGIVKQKSHSVGGRMNVLLLEAMANSITRAV